jgi:hypothetical protein
VRPSDTTSTDRAAARGEHQGDAAAEGARADDGDRTLLDFRREGEGHGLSFSWGCRSGPPRKAPAAAAGAGIPRIQHWGRLPWFAAWPRRAFFFRRRFDDMGNLLRAWWKTARRDIEHVTPCTECEQYAH